MNRLLRHYLARFTRKTYCQSKSISMIVDSVLLFYIVVLSLLFAFSITRLIGKAHTYNVERMNRLLRHYLARFTRKTYCQSKSISMIVDSVLLFLHRHSISSIRF